MGGGGLDNEHLWQETSAARRCASFITFYLKSLAFPQFVRYLHVSYKKDPLFRTYHVLSLNLSKTTCILFITKCYILKEDESHRILFGIEVEYTRSLYFFKSALEQIWLVSLNA